MTDVELTIGGRAYWVACAVGEEAHVSGLGRIINEKLDSLPGGAGRNDSRSLLFAALLLADELHDLRLSLSAPPVPDSDTHMPPERLEALAERLEALADVLEAPAWRDAGLEIGRAHA